MRVPASICRHFSTVIHSCCLPITQLIPQLHTQTHKLARKVSFCCYVHYFSILPELTNPRHGWNFDLRRSQTGLNLCNGSKTLLVCKAFYPQAVIYVYLSVYLDYTVLTLAIRPLICQVSKVSFNEHRMDFTYNPITIPI